MPHHLFAAGETLPAKRLRDLFQHDTYTPNLAATTTDPSLGTLPIQAGKFAVIGLHIVTVEFEIAFGSGVSAGSGTYLVSVPAAWPVDDIASQIAIGQARLRDDSSTNRRIAAIFSHDATHVRMETDGSTTSNSVSNNSPWTWADNDSMRGSFTYFTGA